MISDGPKPAAGELSGLRIGAWTVRPALNEIQRDGRTAHIGPLAMQALVYLADHAGQVVSSDTLIAHVWQGRVVGEGSVYQTINNLRRAMEDDRQHPHYIQTIHKRGYRLVAPVEQLEPTAARGRRLGHGVSVADHERSARSTWHTIGLAVFGVLALSLLFFAIERYAAEDVLAGRALSIAVLPFENQSVQQDHQIFVDGIHNDILAQLYKIDSLDKVISRTSVMGYRDTDKNLRAIGEELGVDIILEGTVQRAGDAARINVQLIPDADVGHRRCYP